MFIADAKRFYDDTISIRDILDSLSLPFYLDLVAHLLQFFVSAFAIYEVVNDSFETRIVHFLARAKLSKCVILKFFLFPATVFN